jgi:hypothetical protein
VCGLEVPVEIESNEARSVAVQHKCMKTAINRCRASASDLGPGNFDTHLNSSQHVLFPMTTGRSVNWLPKGCSSIVPTSCCPKKKISRLFSWYS